MECPACKGKEKNTFCQFYFNPLRLRKIGPWYCSREPNHRGPHVACGFVGSRFTHCAYIEYVENNNELILLKPRKFL